MKHYFFTIIVFITLSRLLTSCANITPLEGGPKDTLNPTVKSISPKNQTTNFKGNKIYLRFSEKVETSKLRDEIQISPYYGKNLDIKTTGYNVTIGFKDSLKPNTTYIVRMNNGIKDITEGNSPKNLQVVFSTGPIIDSLQLHGKVKDQYTSKAVKGVLVGLWKKSDTLNIKKHKPYYYTYTDESGEFLIQNIHSNNYELYAFEDKNKNFEFNSRSEKIGFLDKTLPINSDSTKHITLGLVKQNDDTLAINSINYKNRNCEIGFNKGIDSILIKAKDAVYYTIDKEKKKVTIYSDITKTYTDSIPLIIVAIDSIGAQLKTTKNILFKLEDEGKKEKNKEIKKKVVYLKSVKPSSGDAIIIPGELEIVVEKPIAKVNLSDTTYIKLDNKVMLLKESDLKFNQFRTVVKIPLTTATDSVIVKLPEGFLISSQGDSTTAVLSTFKVSKEEDVALLEVKIKTSKKDYFIELLNSTGEVINTVYTTEKTILFPQLKPGEYQLRAIIDINKNKKFDNGNYRTRYLPEEIIYMEQKITLKQNWEVRDAVFSF